jgi:hypothetical protein
MNLPTDGDPPRHRSYRAGPIMIALTAAACLAAILFRTPIRSCYWAWQILESRDFAERAAPLTCLCNAGNAGRWGTERLLDNPDPEIRQLGLLVLQHVRSDWSRRRSLEMLKDPSPAVREMAALALAWQGNDSVVPLLRQLYAERDTVSAASACLALARLGTPKAIAALTELVQVRPHEHSNETALADVTRRAALVDALAAVGNVDCAAALLDLLTDCRPCDIPTRAERLLAELTPLAIEQGLIQRPTSQPVSNPAIRTIAERAAAALVLCTGLDPHFSCEMPPEQREQAARAWRDWIDARRAVP